MMSMKRRRREVSKYHGIPERCPNCLRIVPEWMENQELEYCSPSCDEEFNAWIQGFIDRLIKKEDV